MRNAKELGQALDKRSRESDSNIRRSAENFPLLEKSVDSFSPVRPLRMEFATSGHRHSIHMNMYFSENEPPCNLAPIDEYITSQTNCGLPISTFDEGGQTSVLQPLVYGYEGFDYHYTGDFIVNLGGFEYDPTGGVIVPLTGFYNIRFVNTVAGVSIGQATVTAQIRRSGTVVLATATAVSPNEVAFYSTNFNLTATGVLLQEGETVSSWLEASLNLAFYTASNLCGLADASQSLYITLVGSTPV